MISSFCRIFLNPRRDMEENMFLLSQSHLIINRKHLMQWILRLKCISCFPVKLISSNVLVTQIDLFV